ncbi:MAG: flagellar hook-associated protein FlgL [Planctomycetales bacterium]|nr:flagellar hook-associated protein FlgL [Planctomycetales bacterium]
MTQSQMSATARKYLAKQSSELFTTQQQISTGLRIQRPSDDPAAIRRSLIQKDRVDRLEAHEVSISHVKSRLESAHVHLQDINSLLTTARQLAIQSQNVTDNSERTAIAAQLDGLLQQMTSSANASDESGYLFSGTAADTRPFPGTLDSSGQTVYAGTPDSTGLYIAGDVERQGLLPGDMVFQSAAREPTVVIGRSGAATGTGTDTAVGSRQLLVIHDSTTFTGGSGILTGTDSAASDTIIGLSGSNVFQINDTSGTGTSGTISLNGGDPVVFNNTMTNLVVTGPLGEKVHVNTTGITAGFNGSVDIEAAGSLSLDGGITRTAISFSTNQQITDSRDGTLVNLDTTAIRHAGTDHVEFPGTSDVFGVIRELRDDILNTRNMPESTRSDSLTRRIGDIERIQDHVLDMVGVQSVSLEQIDRLESRTGDLKLVEKIEYSDTVSADVAEAVLRLKELNNLQQFTMAAVGQLLTPNLLNYIQ